MSSEAKKRGLDKTAQFEETVKFAKMQILTTELQRKIQEEAAKVPPAAIENLLPGVPMMSRPRLSKLTFAGERKLSRLP